MNARPSKFVIAIARWVLMAGIAGIVMGSLAFIDALRAPNESTSRHALLLIAAILLALTFVLAPVVRRAFTVPRRSRSPATRRKTWLDETRECGEDRANASLANDANAHAAPARSLLEKLLIALYCVFALVLAYVLWAIPRLE